MTLRPIENDEVVLCFQCFQYTLNITFCFHRSKREKIFGETKVEEFIGKKKPAKKKGKKKKKK